MKTTNVKIPINCFADIFNIEGIDGSAVVECMVSLINLFQITNNGENNLSRNPVIKISKLETLKCEYRTHLKEAQNSDLTVKTYIRALNVFLNFCNSSHIDALNNGTLIDFKKHLTDTYSPSTINTYITGFNAFLKFINYDGIRIKCIKRQSNDNVENPLTKKEYSRITEAAVKFKGDTCAIIKTLAGTGIRVGELKFFTVEAVKAKEVHIINKGKMRRIPISESLCDCLLEYCDENNITSGIIFTGRDGRSPISTSAVWRKIHGLAQKSGVDEKKLFPHNFRHYYAGCFMKDVNDLCVLKDLLGHTDIKTTTIYTHASGDYVRKCVNKVIV